MGGLTEKDKKSGFLPKIILYSTLILLLSAAVSGLMLWNVAFRPTVTTGQDIWVDIHIPTGSGFDEVIDMLEEKGLIENRSTLEWLAIRKNYPNNINPGRYRLEKGMSNNELVNMLRSGNQQPVNLVFNSNRRIENIASVVARQIEADSSDIVNLAGDTDFLESLGFDKEGIPALFIPNTYEFFWNTSAEQFYRRMKIEYERFWNGDRDSRRNSLGLTRLQVSTLASIVDEETVKSEEMPVIAGVYLNRLNRGMRLQADPTIKYALGDFTVNRILKVHLEIDSPFNTYKYSGLPPGPIIIPSVHSIDAVLNANEHNYLYFCAREDFSGYHRFARTLSEHNRNARLYQNALNKRRIFQ